MTIYPLSQEEIGAKDITHVVTFDYTDLNTTAGLTKTIEILPSSVGKIGAEVSCRGFYVETAFAGTATLTLTVGDGVDPDRYLTAAVADMKTAGPKSVLPTINTQPYTYTAADGVDAVFTATTNNLDQLTVGKVHVFLKVVDLAEVLP